ncbi:uncharacterized protein BYT42DRAFT_589513 [Radiomyces spectabilis]|uniref:uncharacterized protein n=1 Tax=Radiomyces spectabilis TaxID=64574 RepID=UPI0022207F99|nr:uncharacterized protein BYT42DRAFT_589513 [Radiomyces spectabilis]KAI8365314.1 hypothetical protein BYT42DRAFT_589513 [Radiomyces spectabilis]
MATVTEANNFFNALQHEELVKKHQDLQISYEEATRRNLALEQELAKVREQRAREQQIVTVDPNQALLHELHTALKNAQNDAQKLREKNTSLRMDTIAATTDTERVNNENVALKLEIETLKTQVAMARRRESTSKDELLKLERIYNEFREKSDVEGKEFHHRKTTYQRMIDQLTQANEELKFQMSQYRIDLSDAQDTIKMMESKYQKLETTFTTTKTAHERLIETYDQQQAYQKLQIQSIKGDMMEKQTALEAAKQDLEQQNASLETQLKEAAERLQIAHQQFLSSINGDTNGAQAESSTAVSAADSDVLAMIEQYEASGKSWVDVYPEFFDLQTSYVKLRAENEDMHKVYQRLVRAQQDKEQYYERMEKEFETLQNQYKVCTQRLEKHEALYSENEKELQELRANLENAHCKNHQLTASLNDTTYQLRYVLRDIESRDGSFPPEVTNAEELLSAPVFAPTLSHEQVIFKNVTELQQRNQELLDSVRDLSGNLQKKSQALDKLQQQYDQDHQDWDIKFKTISEEMQSLGSRLIDANRQTEYYRNEVLTLKDRVPSGIPGVDDVLKHTENDTIIKELEARHKNYCQETELYIRQMEAELTEAQTNLTKSEQASDQFRAEILELKLACLEQKNNSDMNSRMVDDLRRRISTLEDELNSRVDLLQKANNEVLALKSHLDSQTSQNTLTTAELNAKTTDYQKLLKEYEELAVERGQLKDLINQVHSGTTASSTSSMKLLEHLKTRNEEQKREVTRLKNQLAETQQELDEFKSFNQRSWQDKYVETQKELEAVQESQKILQEQLDKANEERDTALQHEALLSGKVVFSADAVDCESHKHQLLVAEALIQQLETRVENYQRLLERHNAEYTKLSEEHSESTTRMKESMTKLAVELATREARIAENQTQTENALRAAEAAEKAIEEAKSEWLAEKRTLTEDKEDLARKNEAKETELATLRQEIEHQINLVQVAEAKLQAESAARSKDAECIQGLRDDIKKLSQDIAEKEADARRLHEQLKDAETSWSRQKEQMETNQSEVKQSLEKLWASNQSLFQRLENELAKREEATTADDDKENHISKLKSFAPDILQELRDVNALLTRDNIQWRARYLEINKQYEAIHFELTFVERKLKSTRAALENARSESNVSTDQQMKANNELIFYKEANSRQEQRIAELNKRIGALEHEISVNNAELVPISAKLRAVEQQLLQTTVERDNLRTNYETYKKQAEILMAEPAAKDSAEADKVKELESQVAELKEKLELTLVQAKKTGQFAHAYKARWNELKTKVAELEQEKSQMQAALQQQQSGHDETDTAKATTSTAPQ